MDTARFHLSPAPQVLTRRAGAGARRTWAADLLPKDAARTLADGPAAVRARFGLALETVGLDEFARLHGETLPEGFDRAEGYRLALADGLVRIGADTDAARFYAWQTAAQMLCTLPDGDHPVYLVADWPDQKVRGFNVCYHVVVPWMPSLGPDFRTLCGMVEDLAHLKMNALLIEFEGLFPYARHPKASNRSAFTPAEIAELKDLCARNFVEIVPLVQCLGHAYHVLRHREYAHLRELPRTTQQYCPTNPDALAFFLELADEVIAAFAPKRFHIGGDESRRLGQCPRCRAKLAEKGMGALYGDHVNAVSKALAARGVEPIVWGDIAEDHPDILDVLDPAVSVLFWNYDMVDWRPYVLESFLRPGRTVYAGPGAFFGRMSDHMFLYKKAMRNLGLLSAEARRNRLPGTFVTNWSKLAPVEAGLVGLAYGAHLAWSAGHDQEAFTQAFSRIWFGKAVPGMDRFYQLLSETTVHKKQIQNQFWSAPYNELGEGWMPDWLDRYDWSGRDFSVLLKHYTEQDFADGAEKQMRKSLADAVEARAILDAALPGAAGHPDVLATLRMAADSQHVKCRMGLAIGEAVRLLKYPLPDEAPARLAAAAELRGTLAEWADVRAEAEAVLSRTTLPASLPLHMDFRFDPDAAKYMEGFAGMLERGEQLQALVTMKPYAPEDL